MIIIGISAYYHDSAACILLDGKIIAAAQEERFTRVKHDASFPTNAIKYCLNEANVSPDQVSYVVFFEKPFLKFERILETYLGFAPFGFKSFLKAIPIWIKEKLFQKFILLNEISKCLDSHIKWEERLLFSEHHLSHSASAFYPSPFKNAAVLTLDGVGEWTTTSVAIGNDINLKIIKEIHFPHSIGLLYSAFTYYTGFKVNSGEYKVMGLAPYGVPIYSDIIKEKLIKIADDGSFQLDMSYFDFATGLTMTNSKFDALFGAPARKPESELTQREMDLAASVQVVIEEVILKLAKNIATETGEKNLCLAGGVALNCVANGILLREQVFENIWIQPAAGDAGGAIGAALAIWFLRFAKSRNLISNQDQMNGSFLGPQYTDNEIQSSLEKCGANFHKFAKKELIEKVALALVEQKAIGWMQGRMEFGPRSLGGRSIIADPRSELMQKQLNLKVKFRESFRPFAPSVLVEYQHEWFEIDTESPYMLFVADIKKEKRLSISNKENSLFGIDKLNVRRSLVPAITHINYSARIQSVNYQTNPLFHDLISKFYEMTGCPMVVNTSFNVRGEPIVCSPMDAYKCFMGTGLDILVIGNYLLHKKDQDYSNEKDYKNAYELD